MNQYDLQCPICGNIIVCPGTLKLNEAVKCEVCGSRVGITGVVTEKEGTIKMH